VSRPNEFISDFKPMSWIQKDCLATQTLSNFSKVMDIPRGPCNMFVATDHQHEPQKTKTSWSWSNVPRTSTNEEKVKGNFFEINPACKPSKEILDIAEALECLRELTPNDKKKVAKLQSTNLVTSLKPKKKRRKRDEIDRGFKCPIPLCIKSYGSEGALKTHIKLKHRNEQPPEINWQNLRQSSPQSHSPSPPTTPGGSTIVSDDYDRLSNPLTGKETSSLFHSFVIQAGLKV